MMTPNTTRDDAEYEWCPPAAAKGAAAAKGTGAAKGTVALVNGGSVPLCRQYWSPLWAVGRPR